MWLKKKSNYGFFSTISVALNLVCLAAKTKKIGKSLELSRETTASIGIALVPSDVREYSVLYQKADKALYYSKESGRGCYTIYSDKLQSKIQKN